MIIDTSILLASRILGALVFTAAVLGKLRHRDEFIGVVANYRLVPEAWAAAVGYLIVALEIVVAACLASGFQLQAGVALAVVLLTGFAVAMTINLARGRTEIDCGCFQSALRQQLSVALVVRNLLLIAAILPLLQWQVLPDSPLQWLDGVAAGVVLFVLYQVFGDVLALRHAADAIRKRIA